MLFSLKVPIFHMQYQGLWYQLFDVVRRNYKRIADFKSLIS